MGAFSYCRPGSNRIDATRAFRADVSLTVQRPGRRIRRGLPPAPVGAVSDGEVRRLHPPAPLGPEVSNASCSRLVSNVRSTGQAGRPVRIIASMPWSW